MEVYTLTYTVGLSSGFRELIGIYDSIESLEKGKERDMRDNNRMFNEQKYSMRHFKLNKNINEIFMEW